MAKTSFWKSEFGKAAAIFLPIWAACTAFLAFSGDNFLFPISSLVLFGVVFTGAAIFLTRKSDAPPVPVDDPKRESLTLLLYLLVYAFVLFGPVAGALREAITSERAEQLAMLAFKLTVHVVIPALLIRLVHGHLTGILDHGLRRRGVIVSLLLFSTIMIVVAGLLNSIFEKLAAAGYSPGLIVAWGAFGWAWMSVEAGLCEEFLFRGLLQSRLTAWFKSGPVAIVTTSVIFALVHVPALYLRGGEAVTEQASGLPQIIALSIGAIAPISIFFGTLWYRTRSFLLIVVVHGAIDALPALDKLMRIWG